MEPSIIAKMSQFFHIHPEDPQPRLIHRAVDIIREGGVVVYPTDSCYALGCHIGDKAAMERIRQIRQADRDHHFTLICRDLAEIGRFALIDNRTHRLIKSLTPGPYTFLLPATKEVPRRLQNPRRKTIGVRVPDHLIPLTLLDELGEPVMSSTLLLPGDELPLTDPHEIRDRLEHQVDLVIDGGSCGLEPSTVIDLAGDEPEVVRRGKGPVTGLFAT